MKTQARKYPLTVDQAINVFTEFGPLVCLFVFSFIFDFKIGTWALVISTAAALAISLKYIARVPIMPFLGGGVSIAFGLATLYTHNPMWVQIKVTIFNTLFAMVLLASLARGKSLLQHIFGQTFRITPEGWRRISVNWAAFFLFAAVVNELVRWLMTPEMWAAFKVFIIMPLAGLFGVWQAAIVRRYTIPEEPIAVAVHPIGFEAKANQAAAPVTAIESDCRSRQTTTGL
ncbi:MAG: septation protein A [Hyphomicrobiaceae bacterium]|nr:MAG: septation protein A [Hyphomicrobiaceae bacterium]